MGLDRRLMKLVGELQNKIRNATLDSESVKSAIETLSDIGYQYDAGLFPDLSRNSELKSSVGSEPSSLAEALLWKMGKWKVYKDFVKSYNNNGALEKKTDVVFAAFAKHLKDSEFPIYDQHALRALWAIDPNLDARQRAMCKSALIKSRGNEKGKWKATLSGGETINCYNLYVARINILSDSWLSKNALDKLLMPLGQALKANTKDYDEFSKLCSGARDS